MTPLLAALALAAASPETLRLSLRLDDAGVPVDRAIALSIAVGDGPDPVEVVDVVEVVDGAFVVDIPVAPDAPEPLALHVVVDGVAFPPLAVARAWPAVAFAATAQHADVADDTDALDTLGDPATLASLAAAGGPPVAFANVTGVPAGFDDGDDGLVLAPDASFTFVAGTLTLAPGGVPAAQVGPLDAADLADNSVNATHVQPSTIVSADLTGTLPLTTLAPESFGAAQFGAAQLGASASRVELFEIHVDGCSLPRGTLQHTPTCTFTSTTPCTLQIINGNPVLGRVDCTGACSTLATTTCTIPPAGFLVFP
jgi:hypothetical protein